MNRIASNLIPMVQEERNNNLLNYDIYSRLLKDRVVFMLGEVNDNMANNIVAQLNYLNHINKEEKILLVINSPGGSVSAGMSIYDTMNSIKPEVHTLCIGQACSMGAFILAAGDHRSAQPSSRIMIHQPLGGFQGQATDMEIHVKEMMRVKSYLNNVLAFNCGKTYKKMVQDTERDNFMTSFEALEYGLIDEVSKPESSPNKRASKIDFNKFSK